MTTAIIRRDTAKNWAESNPVLFNLEPALDLTNDIVKIGDGVRPYSDLPAYKRVTQRDSTEEPITPEELERRGLLVVPDTAETVELKMQHAASVVRSFQQNFGAGK